MSFASCQRGEQLRQAKGDFDSDAHAVALSEPAYQGVVKPGRPITLKIVGGWCIAGEYDQFPGFFDGGKVLAVAATPESG